MIQVLGAAVAERLKARPAKLRGIVVMGLIHGLSWILINNQYGNVRS